MTGVRGALTSNEIAFTKAEEKIVRLLLADYPTSGLGTATSLAKRAGVSDPTVSRLMVKLGFDGYADFQAQLLSDVEASWHSPLHMMQVRKPRDDKEGAAASFLRSVGFAVDAARNSTPAATFERIARMIVEARHIHLLGGRYSRHVAGLFAEYLFQFRSHVHDLGAVSAETLDKLADMTRKDLLIAFDYRRYQMDVVRYAEQAASQQVRIILFTDEWLSPIAHHAEITIMAPQEVTSPYDTIAPAIAQVEAVIATIVATMAQSVKSRIERLEKIRHDNKVTIDSQPDDSAGSRTGSKPIAKPKTTRRRSNPVLPDSLPTS
jgi:DNA-binding MurR/RpiR family transcriptional regulator